MKTMKRFELQKDRDTEREMQRYTGSVLLPGLRRELRTSTRLLFDYYWQLLERGYTEEQIPEHAVTIRWSASPPLHEDLALATAVIELARHQGLQPSPRLPFYTDRTLPRRIVGRFK
ncbi:MAG: hypothetical protein AAF488_00220 [Planctomycetota bacterium]